VRRLLLLAAVMVLVFAPARAHAYLHVADAQIACQQLGAPYFDAWSKQNIGPGNLWVSAAGGWYQRFPNGVAVDCAWKGNSGWWLSGTRPSQGEVRAFIAGSDEAPGFYIGPGWPQWSYLGVEVGPCCGWHFATPGF
jgi:hypothetical protein